MMDEMVQTDSSFDKNRKRYDMFFIRQQIWNFLNSAAVAVIFYF